jgi:uncharacterized protein YbjQ (UPF0145 family)
MLVTTTDGVEGRRIVAYRGVVSGECIIGANVFRDFFASIRDIVGGRAGSYERALRDAKDEAMADMVEKAEALDRMPTRRNRFAIPADRLNPI